MKKKRVLIIDDEEAIRHFLKLNLEATGSYAVDTAEDALHGYEKIQKTKFDFIFLDVLMPKIEGGEALQTILKMTTAPVVIISGYLPPVKRQEVLQAGAFDVLDKPFTIEQVLQVIHRMLARNENVKINAALPQAKNPGL